MAPLIGDMYALYRARSFPSSIPLRDAVRLLSLYKSLAKDFSLARSPLSEVASLSRRQDATAKLQGWILLRPNPSGTSSVIQRSDARWEGFTFGTSRIVERRRILSTDVARWRPVRASTAVLQTRRTCIRRPRFERWEYALADAKRQRPGQGRPGNRPITSS